MVTLKSKDLKIGGTWFKLPPRKPPNKCTTSKLKVKVLFKKMNYTTWGTYNFIQGFEIREICVEYKINECQLQINFNPYEVL